MSFHARKQLVSAAGSYAFHPQHLRAPAAVAVERLAKLVVAGAPAPRMMAAASEIVAGWREEGVLPGVISDQLEALRAEIDGGLAAAEDYVADADEADRPRARLQLDALRSTQQVLKAEAERFP